MSSLLNCTERLWKFPNILKEKSVSLKRKKVTLKIAFEKKNIGYRFRKIYFSFGLHYFCVFELQSPETMIYDTQYRND